MQVYISLGSNIERERHLLAAYETLKSRYHPLLCSPVYETRAVGMEAPPFHNAVIRLTCEESPWTIYNFLREIENQNGRIRQQERFSSRTLDLDLLLYGDVVLKTPQFELPRSEILTQAFVLKPLAVIAGEQLHPVLHKSYTELWQTYHATFNPESFQIAYCFI